MNTDFQEVLTNHVHWIKNIQKYDYYNLHMNLD